VTLDHPPAHLLGAVGAACVWAESLVDVAAGPPLEGTAGDGKPHPSNNRRGSKLRIDPNKRDNLNSAKLRP